MPRTENEVRVRELTRQLQIHYNPPWSPRAPLTSEASKSDVTALDALEALDILYRHLRDYQATGDERLTHIIGAMMKRLGDDGYECLYISEGNCVMALKKIYWPGITEKVQELREKARQQQVVQVPAEPSILEKFGLTESDINWFGENQHGQ